LLQTFECSYSTVLTVARDASSVDTKIKVDRKTRKNSSTDIRQAWKRWLRRGYLPA